MPKAIHALEPGECRYITGSGPTLYCAEPVWHGATSFCRHHHQLCYVPSASRGRSPISLPVDKLPPPKAAEEHPLDVIEGWKD
jgi:hypothetical protein